MPSKKLPSNALSAITTPAKKKTKPDLISASFFSTQPGSFLTGIGKEKKQPSSKDLYNPVAKKPVSKKVAPAKTIKVFGGELPTTQGPAKLPLTSKDKAKRVSAAFPMTGAGSVKGPEPKTSEEGYTDEAITGDFRRLLNPQVEDRGQDLKLDNALAHMRPTEDDIARPSITQQRIQAGTDPAGVKYLETAMYEYDMATFGRPLLGESSGDPDADRKRAEHQRLQELQIGERHKIQDLRAGGVAQVKKWDSPDEEAYKRGLYEPLLEDRESKPWQTFINPVNWFSPAAALGGVLNREPSDIEKVTDFKERLAARDQNIQKILASSMSEKDQIEAIDAENKRLEAPESGVQNVLNNATKMLSPLQTMGAANMGQESYTSAEGDAVAAVGDIGLNLLASIGTAGLGSPIAVSNAAGTIARLAAKYGPAAVVSLSQMAPGIASRAGRVGVEQSISELGDMYIKAFSPSFYLDENATAAEKLNGMFLAGTTALAAAYKGPAMARKANDVMKAAFSSPDPELLTAAMKFAQEGGVGSMGLSADEIAAVNKQSDGLQKEIANANDTLTNEQIAALSDYVAAYGMAKNKHHLAAPWTEEVQQPGFFSRKKDWDGKININEDIPEAVPAKAPVDEPDQTPPVESKVQDGGVTHIYHFSDGDFDITDPSMRGQGIFPNRSDKGESTVQGTHFYPEGTVIENQLRGARNVYEASVPTEKLYDIILDPEGVYRDSPGAGVARLDNAYNELKTRGYLGVIGGTANDGPRNRVFVFEPVKVSKIGTPSDVGKHAMSRDRVRSKWQHGIDEAMRADNPEKGGYTWDPNSGWSKSTTDGHIVGGVVPSVEITGQITPKDLEAFYDQHRALLDKNPDMRMGIWDNTADDGKWYIDISNNIADQAAAFDLAKSRGEKAVGVASKGGRYTGEYRFGDDGEPVFTSFDTDAVPDAAPAPKPLQSEADELPEGYTREDYDTEPPPEVETPPGFVAANRTRIEELEAKINEASSGGQHSTSSLSDPEMLEYAARKALQIVYDGSVAIAEAVKRMAAELGLSEDKVRAEVGRIRGEEAARALPKAKLPIVRDPNDAPVDPNAPHPDAVDPGASAPTGPGSPMPRPGVPTNPPPAATPASAPQPRPAAPQPTPTNPAPVAPAPTTPAPRINFSGGGKRRGFLKPIDPNQTAPPGGQKKSPHLVYYNTVSGNLRRYGFNDLAGRVERIPDRIETIYGNHFTPMMRQLKDIIGKMNPAKHKVLQDLARKMRDESFGKKVTYTASEQRMVDIIRKPLNDLYHMGEKLGVLPERVVDASLMRQAAKLKGSEVWYSNPKRAQLGEPAMIPGTVIDLYTDPTTGVFKVVIEDNVTKLPVEITDETVHHIRSRSFIDDDVYFPAAFDWEAIAQIADADVNSIAADMVQRRVNLSHKQAKESLLQMRDMARGVKRKSRAQMERHGTELPEAYYQADVFETVQNEIQRRARDIAQAEELGGVNRDHVLELLKDPDMTVDTRKFIADVMEIHDQQVGTVNAREKTGAEQAIESFSRTAALAKLSFNWIVPVMRQAAQVTSTYSKSGLSHVIKGWKSALHMKDVPFSIAREIQEANIYGEKDYLGVMDAFKKTGQSILGVKNPIQRAKQVGVRTAAGEAVSSVLETGLKPMTEADKFMRKMSAFAMLDYMESVVAKFQKQGRIDKNSTAYKTLSRIYHMDDNMILDMVNNGIELKHRQMAYHAGSEIQIRARKADLPIALTTHPYIETASHLRTFEMGQSKLLGKDLRLAAEGNFGPITKTMAASPIVAGGIKWVITQMQDKVTGSSSYSDDPDVQEAIELIGEGDYEAAAKSIMSVGLRNVLFSGQAGVFGTMYEGGEQFAQNASGQKAVTDILATKGTPVLLSTLNDILGPIIAEFVAYSKAGDKKQAFLDENPQLKSLSDEEYKKRSVARESRNQYPEGKSFGQATKDTALGIAGRIPGVGNITKRWVPSARRAYDAGAGDDALRIMRMNGVDPYLKQDWDEGDAEFGRAARRAGEKFKQKWESFIAARKGEFFRTPSAYRNSLPAKLTAKEVDDLMARYKVKIKAEIEKLNKAAIQEARDEIRKEAISGKPREVSNVFDIATSGKGGESGKIELPAGIKLK